MILKREIPSFFGSHNIKNIRWIMPQGIALILLRRITVTCVGQLLLYRLIYWFLGGRLPVYWQFWGCSMRFKLTGASNESLIFCLWNCLTEYRSKWTKYIFQGRRQHGFDGFGRTHQFSEISLKPIIFGKFSIDIRWKVGDFLLLRRFRTHQSKIMATPLI